MDLIPAATLRARLTRLLLNRAELAELACALTDASAALDGSSNDAEHEALVALTESFSAPGPDADRTAGGLLPVSSIEDRAVIAVLAAVATEHDFGGWLARVLCRAATALGSSDALVAGRPGSWEAEHVRSLVGGTVGYDDEFLADYE